MRFNLKKLFIKALFLKSVIFSFWGCSNDIDNNISEEFSYNYKYLKDSISNYMSFDHILVIGSTACNDCIESNLKLIKKLETKNSLVIVSKNSRQFYKSIKMKYRVEKENTLSKYNFHDGVNILFLNKDKNIICKSHPKLSDL